MRESDRLTTRSIGVEAHVDFSPDWDGLSVTANVYGSGVSIDALIGADGKLVIPHECLESAGDRCKIAFQGVAMDDEGVVLRQVSVYADLGIIQKGMEPSGETEAPATLRLWEQIEANLENETMLRKESDTELSTLIAGVNETVDTVNAKVDAETNRATEAEQNIRTSVNGRFDQLVAEDESIREDYTQADAETKDVLRRDIAKKADIVHEHSMGDVIGLNDAVGGLTESIKTIKEFKQDKLTAGKNIVISGNEISASGGGYVAQDNPPTDTSLLWVDTSDSTPDGDLEALTSQVINLETEMPNKLTKPTDAPMVGKVLKVKSVNDDGTFVCEWADDGGAVNDVQVNGESIVADGVANLAPLNGYNNFGIPRLQQWSGLVADGSNLFVNEATPGRIDARSHYYPVSPFYLDYAVKSAMCGGRGAAWTDAEKVAARERIGFKYQKVYEITLEEEVNKFDFSKATLGMTDVYVMIIIPQVQTAFTGDVTLWGCNWSNHVDGLTTAMNYVCAHAIDLDDAVYMEASYGNQYLQSTAYGRRLFPTKSNYSVIIANNNAKFPVGTKITIWGY